MDDFQMGRCNKVVQILHKAKQPGDINLRPGPGIIEGDVCSRQVAHPVPLYTPSHRNCILPSCRRFVAAV
jgi:hypothetical protein